MSLSHSQILKAASTQMLGCLGAILRKGGAHAEALKVTDAVFLDYRLSPDMFPMSRQVQIACDQVARGAARLAGTDLPSFPDTETTFAALIERTKKADAYCQGVSSDLIDKRAGESITIPTGAANTMTMPAGQFLTGFVLPNLYFHATMTYAILRHNGVQLGKGDFLRPG
jgi:uncharacterized protein